MRICPSCGYEIQNDAAKFCKNCGYNLGKISPEAQTPEPQVPLKSDLELDETTTKKNDNISNLSEKSERVSSLDSKEDVDKNKKFDKETFIDSQKPKDYLVWAIITTVCCCVPVGIYAIICSNRVEKYYYSGQIEAAKKQSLKAKKWIKLGVVLGLLVNIFNVLVVLNQ